MELALPAKKNGLSIEEHRQIGELLKRTRGELLTASVTVGNAYPKASTESSCISKAVDALDKAKNLLDNAVFAEHPEQAEPSIYYGRHEPKTERA